MVPKKWSGPRLDTQGSAPLDDIAALDLAAFQLEFLDAEETSSSGWTARCRRASVRWKSRRRSAPASFRLHELAAYQTSVFWHQAMKARGAADLAERRDRLDGAAQIGRPFLRLVAAPRPDLAETAQQLAGIDRAVIDRRRQRCKLLSRDARDLVGNRRCGLRLASTRDNASEPMDRLRTFCRSLR